MIIIRYAEIALKGKNRAFFEKKLIQNIASCLKAHNISYDSIERPRGRIYVQTKETTNCLREVFGIASFSNAEYGGNTLEQVKEKLPPFLHAIKPTDTFRVSCQRLDKLFPLTSQQIEVELGSFVQEQTKATVNLKHFTKEIGIEVLNNHFYIYTTKIQCFGGLPVGVEGSVAVLLEQKQDHLAALLMLKRGASILPVAFTPQSIDLLTKFSHGHTPKVHLLKSLKDIPLKVKALVSGQTLKTYKELDTLLSVLRPIISYTKKQIEEELHDFESV